MKILLLLAVLLPLLYFLFFKEMLYNLGFFDYLRGRHAVKSISEEAYYEQVHAELRQGMRREGLWMKAWSDSGGDRERAEALYIKYRVDAMKEAVKTKAVNDFEIIHCTGCNTKLRIPLGKRLDVRCPKCKHEFLVDSRDGIDIREFYNESELLVKRIGRATFVILYAILIVADIFAAAYFNENWMQIERSGLLMIFFCEIYFSFHLVIGRVRDIGISSWNALYCIVPGLNILFLLFLSIKPGTPGRNQYGSRVL